MKERVLFWDILKGLGIIAIVLGHCCRPAAPYVYSCHLALFFFVSAYFYNEKKYLDSPYAYLGNLFKNNWPKYVFYLSLIIVMRNFFVHFAMDLSVSYYESIGQVMDSIAKAFVFSCSERFGGAMWFVLPNMIAGTILALSVCFSARVSSFAPTEKSKVYAKYIVLVVLAVCLVAAFSRTPMIFGIHNSFLMLPVCLGAYFVRKAAGMDLSKYLKWWLALPFAILIAILIKFAGMRVELSAKIIPGHFWLYVLSFTGIYVFMYLSKVIEKIPHFNKFIAWLGENSFAIMALHFIAIKLVDRVYCLMVGEKDPAVISKWVYSYPKLWWVYLIAGAVLPAIFGTAMKKIKKASDELIEKRKNQV